MKSSLSQALKMSPARPLQDQLRTASICAWIAAPLLFLSAILNGAGHAVENQLSLHPLASQEFMLYRELNTTLLREIWHLRALARGPYLGSELFRAISWCVVLVPVTSLSVVVGGASRSASTMLQAAFYLATALMIVELTFEAGTQDLTDCAR